MPRLICGMLLGSRSSRAPSIGARGPFPCTQALPVLPAALELVEVSWAQVLEPSAALAPRAHYYSGRAALPPRGAVSRMTGMSVAGSLASECMAEVRKS